MMQIRDYGWQAPRDVGTGRGLAGMQPNNTYPNAGCWRLSTMLRGKQATASLAQLRYRGIAATQCRLTAQRCLCTKPSAALQCRLLTTCKASEVLLHTCTA